MVITTVLVLALIAGLGQWQLRRRHTVLPLLQARLGLTDDRDWLAAGTVPSVPELGGSSMVRDALTDLHRLSDGGSVPVAGLAGPWRYVWPRDAAFVAAAFARTGHLSDAESIIDFLQQVQAADGTFQARYRATTGAPPDDRGVQLDGTGWAPRSGRRSSMIMNDS
jgi:GH15 family glucan-1,4-alpha-glucosidase